MYTMLPKVILFNAMSLDGRMDWLRTDLGLFYELAAHWEVDATLSGSETMLAATAGEEEDAETTTSDAPEVRPADDVRPLLVVVDSRGRCRKWRRILQSPWWRGGVALCSGATPGDYLEYLDGCGVDHLIAGADRVDLRAALEGLAAKYGVKTIRVDSGGALNGALLRAGLVDEVSVLVEPCLIGGISPRSLFTAPDLTAAEGVIPLRLVQLEKVREDQVWLRYMLEK